MAEITRWLGGMPAATDTTDAAAPEGPELLPCPFCGNAAKIDWTVRGVQRWFVRCQTCDAEGPQSTACEQAAIDYWNAAGQQNAAAMALLRDVAKAGNLAPAQVAELQRLEGKGDE